ncbi:MAG TPA: response regulator transcription factor [Verrucomicrobiae bacterium]
MARIRILIVDDHALVRAGLRSLLAAQPDMEVVGEAADGVVVVGQCQRLAPEVVLMDLTMPGRRGISAIQELSHECPEVRVLVVTMHDDPAYVRQALLAGAAGYVLKQSLATELINAIRAVSKGQRFVTPALGSDAIEPAGIPPRAETAEHFLGLLTQREQEVASSVALGHTNAEVARFLHITEKTVETHRLHIMSKLGFHSRADLVRFALEHRLIGA